MTQPALDAPMTTVANVAGLVALAAVLGVAMGIVHRWYARSEVPPGLAVLVGLGGVALYLNSAGALGAVIGGDRGLLATDAVLFNATTLVASAVAAAAGGRTGDGVAVAVAGRDGAHRPDVDVGRLVRSMGRAITVELPQEVDDVAGYDPVEPARKRDIAGETLVFKRGLTVEELRERLVARVRDDYGVGHVDVDVDEEGTVTYLAVGSRAAGLGPTLPPGSVGVAVRADPAHAASAGDLVQLWTAGPDGPERVATGDLRGTADDVATVAVDAADADSLSPTDEFRLVTLPVEPRADREFAALLRAADETLGATTVAAGSDLDGSTVADVGAVVVAVCGPDGTVDPIPPGSRALAAGETVYAVGRPDRLRTLEAASRPGTDNH